MPSIRGRRRLSVHRRGSCLLAVALAVATAPACADPSLPDPAAVAEAIDSHPHVVAARARLVAAQAAAKALARGSHEFTATGSYVKRSVDREGGYDEYDAQLTRGIRLPGKARLDRDIGMHGVDAADNRAEDMRHQAALMLAQGWWDWLGAASEAAIDRQAVENYEALVRAVRRRMDLRDAAQLDVDQAQAALGGARFAAEQSSGRERQARARLAAQFPGLPLPETPPPIDVPALPDGGLEVLRDQVLARSHEVAAAEAEARRARAAAERARRERMADPSVGLRVFSERSGAERGAGVLFSLPIGGGHRSALADKAVAEAGAAEAELQAVRFGIRETAEADLTEARHRFLAWQRAREGLDAQIAALTKLRRGHGAGEIDLIDLLQGERQVHDAFRAEVTARAESRRAITRLRIDSHDLWLGD